jgi:type II secretory pathway pseudopilin PulG
MEQVGQVGRVRQVGLIGWAGFSLIELVVAMGISMIVMAGAFTALESAYGRFGAETDAADATGRLRVAVETLSRAIEQAAAVVPNAANALTVMYLDAGASRTTTAMAVPRQSGEAQVNADPGCPVGDATCGFTAGDTVVIREPGEFDPFVVTAVAGPSLTLTHLAPDAAGSHPAGADIARAVVREFFIDGAGRLVRRDAGGSALPIVEGASGLVFEYFASSGVRVDPTADPRAIAAVETHLSLRADAGNVSVSWRIAPRNLDDGS